MKKMISPSLLFLLLQSFFSAALFPGLALAQTTQTAQTPATPAGKTDGPPPFGLTDGTPVKLKLGRNMSSSDAKTGETVDFEVVEDVKIGDIVIIPRGGTALGTVTDAKPKRRMGRAGRLSIKIDSVGAASGEKLPL